MVNGPIIIAIDGPSAGGKGTIAKRLAAHFGYAHLDTGLLYRAVGLGVLRAGENPSDAMAAEKAARAMDAQALSKMLDNDELRGAQAADAASQVAAVPGVRAALLKFQKDFCASPPDGKGAVLDGRDIGTVIAPGAHVKIYVTASIEARAARRLKELEGRGESSTLEAVLDAMQKRDARDERRAAAPAIPAPDAVTLDTTKLNADEAFAAALRIARAKLTAAR